MVYKLKENDLVVIKPEKPFPEEWKVNGVIPRRFYDPWVFARIRKIDVEKDLVFVDEYSKCGSMLLCGRFNSKAGLVDYDEVFLYGLPLKKVEQMRMYMPMDFTEIKYFQQGLKEAAENMTFEKQLFTAAPELKLQRELATKETIRVVNERIELARSPFGGDFG